MLPLLLLTVLASAQPVVRHYEDVEWKVSGSLPAGESSHDYHLLYEDKATKGIQTYVRFDKGFSLPSHTHTHDEIIVVLKGKLTLEIGGKETVLKPGSYAVIPGGTLHSMKNTGRGKMEMVVSWSGPVDFKGISVK
jgi:quercetin dioxygenase-like cupin family protein